MSANDPTIHVFYGPDHEVTDKYVGMVPWMVQWWLDHLDSKPAVVIRCGQPDLLRPERECRNAIGEVKADGDRVLAMSKTEHPEVTTDWTPLAALTVEELAAEIAERDAQVLHYSGNGPGDGSIVYKRSAWESFVAPIDKLTYYVCRVHGDVSVDTADLAAFVREVLADARSADKRSVTRTYCPTRDIVH